MYPSQNACVGQASSSGSETLDKVWKSLQEQDEQRQRNYEREEVWRIENRLNAALAVLCKEIDALRAEVAVLKPKEEETKTS